MIERANDLKYLANRLIKANADLNYIRDGKVKFVVLRSDEEKYKDGKAVLGECIKVQKNYKWCVKYDFMIVIYTQNTAGMSDKQIEILLNHELRHIGVDLDGKEPRYYIVPHDIEEFWAIINTYGLDWQVR